MKCPEQANPERQQIGSCQGLREGGLGVTANSYGISFQGDERCSGSRY